MGTLYRDVLGDSPIALTDDQLTQVMRHAAVLHPQMRRVFVEHLAYELRGRTIGDGVVFRACAKVLKESGHNAAALERHRGVLRPTSKGDRGRQGFGPPSAPPGMSAVLLAQLYDRHADDCARSAEQTDNPARRALLLKFADQWRHEAQQLRATEERRTERA